MTSNFLLGTKPDSNSHFNIIIGIDDESIYVNNPLQDSRGGEQQYPINGFFFGLYANSYWDIDNGSLIKIKKKS